MEKKIKTELLCAAIAGLAFSFGLGGCARELSHTEHTKVHSNGTVTTKETSVKQLPDGTITKTEESKTTRP